MKRFKTSGAIIIGILLCLTVANMAIADSSVVLTAVPYVYQREIVNGVEMTEWCWAACTKMILDYHMVTQHYRDPNADHGGANGPTLDHSSTNTIPCNVTLDLIALHVSTVFSN
jgi:hypothetical protein